MITIKGKMQLDRYSSARIIYSLNNNRRILFYKYVVVERNIFCHGTFLKENTWF